MYVPNYVPEPVEVPGNVTEERYAIRLIFIRRVALLHTLSIVFVGLFALRPWPAVGWVGPLMLVAISLIALDLLRIFRRGRAIEARVSAILLPLLIQLVGWAVREGMAAGAPVWAIAAGPLAASVYTLICGRDFSFQGCFVLSWIASTVAVSAIATWDGTIGTNAAIALVANTAFLIYYVYDLASLMQRRRRGEELAAVVDLYRDIFNIFGYIPRVIAHWRRHNIWTETRKR